LWRGCARPSKRPRARCGLCAAQATAALEKFEFWRQRRCRCALCRAVCCRMQRGGSARSSCWFPNHMAVEQWLARCRRMSVDGMQKQVERLEKALASLPAANTCNTLA
jgi:hypothetical protein